MNHETEELDRWADDGGAINEDTCRESAGPLSYQVGGDHYKKYKYQPIQFFNEIPLDFNRANAIKYLARWKKKNGIEDLKKAVQYLRFTETKGEEMTYKILRFVRQFEDPERRIILSILADNIREAREEIQELIEIEEANAKADGTPDANANLFEESETRKQ